MDHPRAETELLQRLRHAAHTEDLPIPAPNASLLTAATTISAGSPHQERFLTEITHSLHGHALALTAATTHPTNHLTAAHNHHHDPSVYFEQLIITGHPTHPLARHRHPLTDDETRAYAPEHRPTVTLPTYPTTATRRGHHPPEDLPLHPWQAHRYRTHLPHPTGDIAAVPLASLRTLSTGDTHIKCAIDLQLTSALRGVSHAAAHNGPLLSDTLTPLAADEGILLTPESSIAPHTPHAASLSAITRPAPHTLAPHTTPIPLAALAETCPTTQKPVAATLIDHHPHSKDHWWTHLCDLYITRPLRLLAHHHIALEAHGQNTLIAFRDTTPHQLIYRDLGGIKIPYQKWPHLPGNLQTDHPAQRHHKLLAAYHTTLTDLITNLSNWYRDDPAWWWNRVAHAADTALNRYPEIAKVTLTKPWPVKALITMRLAHHPTTDQWATTHNPLHTQT